MRYLNKKFKQLSGWITSHLLPILFVLFVLVGSFIVLFNRVVIIVPAGNIGVLYRALGGGVDLDDVLPEGLNVVWPWNKVTQYNARIQSKMLEIEVLTSDLLKSKVKISFQYEINRLTLPMLHKYVGPEYLETMVVPEVTSITREMFAKLTSSQAFTSGINQMVNEIAINADRVIIDKISPPGLTFIRLIRVSATQLDSITFPPAIQTAIEGKIEQAQLAEAYLYKIEAAKKESERKVIEAAGIKRFQDIVNAGLTDNYLRLMGIEATKELAKSNNAKTVVFGSGPSGLPLILGDEKR